MTFAKHLSSELEPHAVSRGTGKQAKKKVDAIAGAPNIMLSDRTYNVQAIIDGMGKIRDLDLRKVARNRGAKRAAGPLSRTQSNWNSALNKGQRAKIEKGNSSPNVRGRMQQ